MAPVKRRPAVATALLLLVAVTSVWIVLHLSTGRLAAVAVSCREGTDADGIVATHHTTPKTEANTVFGRVYATQFWGADGRGSGSGSTRAATKVTRLLLESLVKELGIRSLIDAPCGALQWTPLLLEPLLAADPCFSYVGLDAAENVIRENVERFAAIEWSRVRLTFATADLAATPLWKLVRPRGVVGGSAAALRLPSVSDSSSVSGPIPLPHSMLLCRDALQHVPLAMAVDMLRSFVDSGVELLLVGSYAHTEAGTANWNIPIGSYYNIDVREAPFRLGEPERVLDEQTGASSKGGHGPKLLLLYRMRDLRRSPGDWEAMAAEARGFREKAPELGQAGKVAMLKDSIGV